MARATTPWIFGAGIALLALSASGILLWRSVHVERADATDAQRRFQEIRRGFPSAPLVVWDPAGRLVRNGPPAPRGPRPSELHVLVYRSADERLIQADAPLWFIKVKGPVASYAFRGTGFDLAALGLTASDLEEAGAGLVVDQTRKNGDRLLAWTE